MTQLDFLETVLRNEVENTNQIHLFFHRESELTGGAMHFAERVKNEYPQYDVRVTILGHLQRSFQCHRYLASFATLFLMKPFLSVGECY